MLETWKAPGDNFNYSMDFTPTLVAGEGLSSITSVTSRNLSNDTSSTTELIGTTPAPAISGNSVVFWLKNGQQLNSHHRVLVVVLTNTGHTYTGILEVDVLEA
jgi:hypothetical protein